jgi:hypothetical protein
LDILSAYELLRDMIVIQELWMSDDEPRSNAVKIVCHLMRMLMSTVLKDVVHIGVGTPDFFC